MSQLNQRQKTVFNPPPTGMLGLGWDLERNLLRVNPDGTTTIIVGNNEIINNIIANLGVGLAADLPTSGITSGDIYATTDTFEQYYRKDAISWTTTPLEDSQLITDTSQVAWIIYQYDGTEVQQLSEPDGKVRASAADTTSDYLTSKLEEGVGITLSITNPGANEKIKIDGRWADITNGISYNDSVRIGDSIGADLVYRLQVDGGNVAFRSPAGELRYVFFGGTSDTADANLNMYNASAAIKVRISTNGDSYFSGGNVGFGTVSPSNTVGVQSQMDFMLNDSRRFTFGYDSSTGYAILKTLDTLNGIRFGTDTAPSQLIITSSGAAIFSSTVTATDFIQSSDFRLKENIKPIENKGIDTIQLNQFNFQSDKGKRQRYGIIAQELEKLYPEMVHTNLEGFKTVSYTDYLLAKVDSLEKRLLKLENK